MVLMPLEVLLVPLASFFLTRKTNSVLNKSIAFIEHLNGDCHKNRAGVYIKVRRFNIALYLLNTSSTGLRFAKFIFQQLYSFYFSPEWDIFHYSYYIQAGFIIFASIEICLFPLISSYYQPAIISFLKLMKGKCKCH